MYTLTDIVTVIHNANRKVEKKNWNWHFVFNLLKPKAEYSGRTGTATRLRIKYHFNDGNMGTIVYYIANNKPW